jgi:hypothetical protein
MVKTQPSPGMLRMRITPQRARTASRRDREPEAQTRRSPPRPLAERLKQVHFALSSASAFVLDVDQFALRNTVPRWPL